MSQQPTWNFGRFMKTLSYFGAVPFLSELDWFQQWFGSRSNPKVNSTLMAEPVAETADRSVSIAALDQTAETGAVLLLVNPPLQQQFLQQLTAQGQQVRVIAAADDRPSLEAAGAEVMQPDAAGQITTQATEHVAAAIIDSAAVDRQQLQHLITSLGELGLSDRTLFDFQQPSQDLKEVWGALDDVVMGGVSESSIRFDSGVAYFSGVVSTANSGGFASVRTRNFEPSLDLSGYDGIELRVKGDGNRYKFMLRSETRWDGIAYCYSFDTVPDEWITLRIPFTALIPVFRAKTVNTGKIDQHQICATQLMLSKFEYDGGLNPHFEPGFFQLQIASIRAYRQDALPKLILLSQIASTEAGTETNREGQEAMIRQSGIPYAILRLRADSAVPDSDSDLQSIQLSQTEQPVGGLSPKTIAALCLQTLQQPQARNATFSVSASTIDADKTPLFDALQPDR